MSSPLPLTWAPRRKSNITQDIDSYMSRFLSSPGSPTTFESDEEKLKEAALKRPLPLPEDDTDPSMLKKLYTDEDLRTPPFPSHRRKIIDRSEPPLKRLCFDDEDEDEEEENLLKL